MKITFLVLCISGAICATMTATIGSRNKLASNGVGRKLPETMFHIGDADGKSFYGDLTKMGFSDASSYCWQNNMTLASVTTQARQDLLKSVLGQMSLQWANFWTSGRDSWTHAQFSWYTGNGVVPVDPIVNPYLANHQNVMFMTCLTYHVVVTSTDLDMTDCWKDSHSVLCEG